MARRLIVPPDVAEVARRAIRASVEVPTIAYRLASGECYVADRDAIALFALDNTTAYNSRRCTVTAALHGGAPGRTWALAALGMEVDVERIMNDLSRLDQHLVPKLSTAIALAWRKAIEHATTKASVRLARSTEGRQVSFSKFPNRKAAQVAGLDDLLHKTWDSFKEETTEILSEYARQQAAILAPLDPGAAKEVQRQVNDRALLAVAALVAFMDDRARSFITGDAPYEPQDFLAGRAVTAWVSGALPAPDGYAYVDLAALGKMTATALSTAEMAAITFADVRLARTMTWEHGFFGEPMIPYQPHVDADRQTFTEQEVALLDIYPGDHIGCRCELVPSWSVA